MELMEFMQVHEELMDIIQKHGEHGCLDVNDLNLGWTYWDDNIDERTDENGETSHVTEIRIMDDGTGYKRIMVYWDNQKPTPLSELDYDDFGYNCAEYIADEIFSAY